MIGFIPKGRFKAIMAQMPILSVDIVCLNQGRVLLLKRKGNLTGYNGLWATPGGRIFRDERVKAAAKRIMAREAGIKISRESFAVCGIVELLRPVEHSVTVVALAESQTPEVRLDETSSAYKWADPETATLNRFYRQVLKVGLKGRKA